MSRVASREVGLERRDVHGGQCDGEQVEIGCRPPGPAGRDTAVEVEAVESRAERPSDLDDAVGDHGHVRRRDAVEGHAGGEVTVGADAFVRIAGHARQFCLT
jgi:hypothetical protein